MLSFFPLDVLDEIWDLIESVSEGFLTFSSNYTFLSCIFVKSNLYFLSETCIFNARKNILLLKFIYYVIFIRQ